MSKEEKKVSIFVFLEKYVYNDRVLARLRLVQRFTRSALALPACFSTRADDVRFLTPARPPVVCFPVCLSSTQCVDGLSARGD